LETIIARQPIFNAQRKVFAYELLYRGADTLSLANVGGNRATGSLLTSSFLTEGLEKISGNKPCFVNFTQELLLENIAEGFSTNDIVIEILEDVQPTDKIITTCKGLKNLGYTLALDDFVYHNKFIPLIELADIIKIDFLLTSAEEMHQTLEFLSQYKIDFLAEKVETHDQFGAAQKLGFKYFQGYFFARPEEVRIKELSTSKITLLNLLSEINQQTFSAKKLTAMISADVSLSYRLLRYINSAYFYLLTKITSIPYAVTYLGEYEIRRFVTLAVISEISSNKPVELVRLAAVRAKFCEKLGQECPGETNQNELFLLGLLSLLDAMLDTPITDILNKIPISDNIKQALIDRKGPLSIFLKIVVAYERGNTEECFQAVKQLRVSEEKLYPMYLSSLEYADAFVNL